MTSDLDVRCLNTARDFRGTDAGSLLIQAADEIASLRTHFDQQLSIATEAVSQLERLRAENERLRIAERGAFEFAFWSWAGPTNDAEFKECERQCAEAWIEYSNAVPRPQITNG